MLNDRLLIKLKDEFLGKGVKYTENERKAILKAYRGYFGGRTFQKPIFTMYREFLTLQNEKGYEMEIRHLEFDVYDLYLYHYG